MNKPNAIVRIFNSLGGLEHEAKAYISEERKNKIKDTYEYDSTTGTWITEYYGSGDEGTKEVDFCL